MKNHIDLNDKYCRLENGSIEPLFHPSGNPRKVYKDENDEYYLDHDVSYGYIHLYLHSKIVETFNEIRAKEETKQCIEIDASSYSEVSSFKESLEKTYLEFVFTPPSNQINQNKDGE